MNLDKEIAELERLVAEGDSPNAMWIGDGLRLGPVRPSLILRLVFGRTFRGDYFKRGEITYKFSNQRI